MKIFRVVGLLFFMIGIGCTIGGVISVLDTIRFFQNAIEAQGTVIGLETRLDEDNTERYDVYQDFAFIQFQSSSGENIVIEKQILADFNLDSGEVVTFKYLEEDPESARMSNSFFDQYGLPLIFLIFGIAFTAGGAGLFYQGARYAIRKMQSKGFTEIREMSTFSVVENPTYSSRTRTAYQVIVKGIHPLTREEEEFKSTIIMRNPEDRLTDKITVRFHPKKKELYWVDVDGLE
jgi:hypothetical protein